MIKMLNTTDSKVNSNVIPFTPVLVSSGNPQPVIGNSVFTASYQHISEKLIFIRYRLSTGTTFAQGTYVWQFMLPNNWQGVANYPSCISAFCSAYSGTTFTGTALIAPYFGGTNYLVVQLNAGGLIGAGVPINWNGSAGLNQLMFSGILEIA